MPTSDIHNISAIVTAVTSFAPTSILDVGCGFGKYGVLLREYTDIAAGRYQKASWQVRIVGVDGFEGYRNQIWDAVYNEVRIGEIANTLPLLGNFDVVLIADVIEHFDKQVAKDIVAQAAGMAKAVVVSTPHVFFPQTAEFENEYERHKCLWTANDTPPGFYCLTVPLLACNMYVISSNPIPPSQIYPTDWIDLLFLRSRRKLSCLGYLGWPLSAFGRAINRVLS